MMIQFMATKSSFAKYFDIRDFSVSARNHVIIYCTATQDIVLRCTQLFHMFGYVRKQVGRKGYICRGEKKSHLQHSYFEILYLGSLVQYSSCFTQWDESL